MWHDIDPPAEAEYNVWHTREHMPERVGIPGFLVGRRYSDCNADKFRYFTLYEGRALDVFCSEAYLARLNAPTQWSTRVQPYFRNFIRAACQTASTCGYGIGGALLTARVHFVDGGEPTFRDASADFTEQLGALPGVTGVHVGVAEPSVTSTKTAETVLRQLTNESLFDGLVLVEGIGRRELQTIMTRVEQLLRPSAGVASADYAVYELAYLLASDAALDSTLTC
jgi:hypothetical protein